MFIELHMIQNFAPSNLNRDDTNNPKDCEFGGHRRARISSQALKNAIRHHNEFGRVTGVVPSIRTKLIVDGLLERMENIDFESAKAIAIEFAKVYSSKKGKVDDKNPDKTATLLFMADEELGQIAQQLSKLPLVETITKINELNNTTFKKPEQRVNNSPLFPLVKEWVIKTKYRTSAPDIALFGRMLADRPETNIDAACQVAHAISTHRINMEMDFYTAVDDLQTSEQDEGAGAGMMGFTSFNSACFYRYARIDWRQLVKNLGDDKALARRTVEGFLRAAIDAIPSGKQNSFAAQNPTSLAVAVVREDGKSWNLANAFETPVRSKRDSGLIEPSIQALDAFWGNLTRARDDAQSTAVAAFTDQYPHALANLQPHHQPTFTGWINAITDALPKE
jgi:CRISPR system Cascade subunit CasC